MHLSQKHPESVFQPAKCFLNEEPGRTVAEVIPQVLQLCGSGNRRQEYAFVVRGAAVSRYQPILTQPLDTFLRVLQFLQERAPLERTVVGCPARARDEWIHN